MPYFSFPVIVKKNFAAPFGQMSPQLQGARSDHEQTYQILRKELPNPLKQRKDKLKSEISFLFASLV